MLIISEVFAGVATSAKEEERELELRLTKLLVVWSKTIFSFCATVRVRIVRDEGCSVRDMRKERESVCETERGKCETESVTQKGERERKRKEK